jgi:hypothetical protein
MHKEDAIEVIEFNSQVRIAQPFTNDVAGLERAIRQSTVNGSTSLYNAIYVSLNELKKERARSADEIRRQAIVVLSDGDDTSSLVEYDVVLDLAKRSETAIYAIGLRQAEIGRPEVQGGGVRASATVAGNRRARVLPHQHRRAAQNLRADFEELASSTASRTRRRTRCGTRAWRRIDVRCEQAGADRRAPGAATTARRRHNRTRLHLLPAPAVRRPPQPRTSRTSPGATCASAGWRRRLLGGGVLAHTFLIGMQTVQAGHARSSARARRFRRSSGSSACRISTSS